MTRLLWKEKPAFTTDERSLSYRYDSELGWFPIANSNTQFNGGRLIRIQHNADGFRDRAHTAKSKKRIAFVGDSFVWGYDAEQEERFTEKLQALLPDWEILNLGVSGYGTDQEFILLQKYFERYQPEIVVLVFSDNDVEENTLNQAHGGYYKPYFEEVDHQLVERGVPVPKCLRYYRAEHPLFFRSELMQFSFTRYLAWSAPRHVSSKNPTLRLVQEIRTYVESKGAKFVLAYGTEIEGAKKRAFSEATRVNYLFLLDSAHLTWDYMYNTGGHHWTPKGHDEVCSKLHQFLVTHDFLQGEHPQGAQISSPK